MNCINSDFFFWSKFGESLSIVQIFTVWSAILRDNNINANEKNVPEYRASLFAREDGWHQHPTLNTSQTPWISHPGAPVSVLGTILNLTCIYISQDPGIEWLPIQESVKFHQFYVITTLHRFIITYTQASVLPLSRTNIHSKTFKVTEY